MMSYLLNVKLRSKKILCHISCAGFCLFIVACQSTEQVADKKTKIGLTMCPSSRPQICTMEYMPVCGSKSDASTKTYGNACGACGDIEVTGYALGACKTDEEN